MNDSLDSNLGVIFCIEMPKHHYDKLVSLFEKLSYDLTGDKDVDVEDYLIFIAFLEAMKNK